MNETIRVIIPAYNEENSIARVIRDIPKNIVKEIIAVNNGSTDATREVACRSGATTLDQPLRGYGNACLKAMEYIKNTADKNTDIIVFIDADYSDYPGEMNRLIQPITEMGMDLVIGSRSLGEREKGSMTPQQIFGNWLATRLLKIMYGIRFTDLGPFRAIRWNSLKDLGMEDKNYGWTVEMQLKAAKKGFKCTEVPVSYRKRIGKSKVSGTIKGSILAGEKIIRTIFKYY